MLKFVRMLLLVSFQYSYDNTTYMYLEKGLIKRQIKSFKPAKKTWIMWNQEIVIMVSY